MSSCVVFMSCRHPGSNHDLGRVDQPRHVGSWEVGRGAALSSLDGGYFTETGFPRKYVAVRVLKAQGEEAEGDV
jgi:hypothetical protein